MPEQIITNHNKTFSDLVWGHNVSGKEEKLKEIIYDARQNREFDYISAAEQNGILERKIIVPGFKGRKFMEAGYVYAPYIPMFKMPLVRQEFPELVAEDLVSVQPMSKPCSVSFCVDYEVPEVELELVSTSIVARPRKLKCAWEVEQMVKEYGFSNEKYITDMIAEKIRLDIDREILHRQTVPLMPLTLTTGVNGILTF